MKEMRVFLNEADYDQIAAALEAGDYDQVEEAYKTGLLPSRSDMSLLYRAIEKSLPQAVAFLLKKGVRPVTYRAPPLAKCHSIEIFDFIEQAGWPFETEGYLILAEALDSQEKVDWLLNHGVPLDFPQSNLRYDLKKGERDDTVGILNQAAAQGNMKMFDYLVSRGADPSQCLALHYAALYKSQDPAQVKSNITYLLQKYKYDINGDEKCGGLVDRKMTYIGDEGPPLVWAIYHHNLPAVQSFLCHGTEASTRTFLVAIERDNLDALKLLLEAGGNATKACEIAAYKLKIDAARICLEHGADPDPALVKDGERLGKSRAVYRQMERAMKKLLNDPKYRKVTSQMGGS